jgi:hypothetical protein
VDRDAATTYLTTEFAELAAYTQFTTDQTTTAYSTATDMALRQLGYTEDVLPTTDVPQAQVMGYIWLLRYYALSRFSTALSPMTTVTLPGPSTAMRNQAFQQVNVLLQAAESNLAKLGVDLNGAMSFQLGRLSLDFQEPSVIGEYSAQWWSDAYGGW